MSKHVNSPGNPAQSGSIIVFFATGAGQTDPPGTDGLIAMNILPTPRLPVSVRLEVHPRISFMLVPHPVRSPVFCR